MRNSQWLSLVLGLAVVAPLSARGQSVANGQIGGEVTDPTGAAIPNAQVKATQTATGFVRIAVTGSSGVYVIPGLPVGPYTLEATAKGFGAYIESGINLQVSNNLQINLKLKIGEARQTVQVSGSAPMIDTRDNSISQVIGQQQTLAFPLNGRQVTTLILLSGGAVSAPSGGLLGTGKSYPGSVTLSVAGSAPSGNSYLMDGGENEDAFSNVNLPYPFPDAVREFSVQTNGLSARYGVHSGSVVNVVTQSGTNHFHGVLFEFLRNGDMDARNYFAPARDTLKQNQFGGTIGGPILKDKLLFFFGYQGTTTRTAPATNVAYVPTAAALHGDFSTLESATCQSKGEQVIVDPATGLPFTNDYVDPSYFNASALAFLKYVPASTDQCGKILFSIPSATNENQYIGRFDWVASNKNVIFGRYFATNNISPAPYGGNILATDTPGQIALDKALTLGDTYVFSPNITNSLHLAGTILDISRAAPADSPSISDLGINVYQDIAHYVQFSITGHFSSGSGGPPIFLNDNTIQATDDIDIVKGRHQLSFGGQWIHFQYNDISRTDANGAFAFNGQFSNDAQVDFLLGLPSSDEQGQDEHIYFRQNYIGLYAEDNFQLNRRLTLNYGFRWEPFLPETDSRIPGPGLHFSPEGFAAGTTSQVFVNAPPGLSFFGDKGFPSGFGDKQYDDFDPRIGFAWDPTGTGHQSIRASYGIFYDTPIIFYNAHLAGVSPFSALITVNAPSGGLTNPWSSYPGGNPFPLPYPPTKEVLFPVESSYSSIPFHWPPTYAQQWNLSYEWQPAPNWSVSVTYLGNKTTHIWAGDESNPAVYIPGMCNGKPCSTTANTNQRRVLYLQNPLTGIYYASVGVVDPGANAEYNGLALKVQHRFAQDFTLLSTYTYSHCINEGEVTGAFVGATYQNPYDRDADRGNCNYDIRQVFNTSFVVTSPHFQSRQVNRFLGNWQLSSIITKQTGSWFSVTTGVDASLTGVGLDRPNVVGNPYPTPKTIQQWIQPSAFVANSPGTYGDSGFDSLVGPGTFNTSATLSRFLTFHEGQQLEVRFEAFNLFNSVDFSNPTAALNSSTFGQILSAADPRILQIALKYHF